MNDVDPQAWLADVLVRLPDYPANKVADLLPWNWKANLEPKAAVAAWAILSGRSRLPGVLAGFILSVGPLCGEQVLGGMQFSVVVIVPKRDGKDCASSQIRLDIAQDPFMAHVYRTALIVALEEFFGRVQIFGNELTLAKYCHGVTIIIQLHTRSIVMALTSAEKQQHYRERHLGVRTKDRIQLFISVQAKAQLRRLARHHGCTV